MAPEDDISLHTGPVLAHALQIYDGGFKRSQKRKTVFHKCCWKKLKELDFGKL